MKLRHVRGRYGVATLPATAAIPDWLGQAGLSAVVRTEDELSVICAEACIPESVTAERGWACFRSVGPFAFDEAGIVASLVSPISAAGIGVFVLCTFDGEHILCPAVDMEAVTRILTKTGHVFES